MVLKNACKQRHFHAKCLAFYLKILPASEFLPVIHESEFSGKILFSSPKKETDCRIRLQRICSDRSMSF